MSEELDYGEESGYVRVRMLISSIFEIRDTGGGVVLIREPSLELMTGETLVGEGFGC